MSTCPSAATVKSSGITDRPLLKVGVSCVLRDSRSRGDGLHLLPGIEGRSLVRSCPWCTSCYPELPLDSTSKVSSMMVSTM